MVAAPVVVVLVGGGIPIIIPGWIYNGLSLKFLFLYFICIVYVVNHFIFFISPFKVLTAFSLYIQYVLSCVFGPAQKLIL